MRPSFLALLAAFLLLPGCPSGDDDDATSDDDDATSDDDDATSDDDDATGDDDDATGDDDDATGDDDDATGDDDDATGDDDDSAGDDDDSAGDDDDSAGDDDDSAAAAAWVGETFCLDWSSVTWNSPDAGTIAQADSMGFNLMSVPLLLSPLSLDNGFEARVAGGLTGVCAQNTTQSTADTVGTWTDPALAIGPTAVTLSLAVGNFPLLDLEIDGTMNAPGTQITNSTIEALIDMGTTGGICSMASCQPCPGSGAIQCLPLQVVGANWISQGAAGGTLQLVP
jgi:hypothetical protein